MNRAETDFMRSLPKKGFHTDIEQAKHMVNLPMEAGFTYFDTAYVYMGSKSPAMRGRFPWPNSHAFTGFAVSTKFWAELLRQRFYNKIKDIEKHFRKM